ncbi:hypothetical protein I4U23_016860 [Adineta vaga]|nr:hypothetical protein I4U23_016860 [Adineta vaga]
MQLPDKYETLVGEHGSQLSGGEKQRIVLARAYLRQSPLLLLDEATSALDTYNEKIVQDSIYRACQGRTTIVIAHRLKTIEKAHRIYVLANGSVIEEGTHETLMSKEEGIYRAMVDAQQVNNEDNENHQTSNISESEEKYTKDKYEFPNLLDYNQDLNTNKISLLSSSRQSAFIRLLNMNRPEWIIILFGCIASLACGASTTIFAILLSKILHVNPFEKSISVKQNTQVLTFSFFCLLLGISILITRLIQFTTFASAGSKLTQRIRIKALSQLLLQEVAYFDLPENTSGAIANRLSSEAASLQQISGARLGIICEAFGTFGFAFILGIFFSWQLTIIITFFIIFCFLLGCIQVLWEARYNKHSKFIIDKANSLVVEVVQNIRIIKQLSIEKQVLQQYSKLLHQSFKVTRTNGIVSALLYGIYWSLPSLILWFLYRYALSLVEKHLLKTDDMLIVFVFATFTFESLRIVMSFMQNMGTSLSAARNFFNLFDRKPKISNMVIDDQQIIDLSGTIEFNQVRFSYPTRPQSFILNRFQLSIKSGQRIAIIGASGCGKSTIIQLLERFYDVTDGHILLNGIDIRKLNIRWLRSQIGLVSQEPVLFDLTIAENIVYGRENISLEDIINAAKEANIHQFISELPQGYDTRVGNRGVFLSGGQKQRVAIARALIRRPKILLLDEPTSALDLYNEQIVQLALEQLQIENPHRTSLTIAHRLSTIHTCDLICILDKGHVVANETHASLIQHNEIYYKMFT